MLVRARPENVKALADFSKQWDDDGEPLSEDDLHKYIEEGAVFCTTDDYGDLTGVMVLAKNLDESWHLTWICIHPDHQNEGHGTRLLNLLTEHLDSLPQPCILSVKDTNAGAKRLYERFNFKETIQDSKNPLDYNSHTLMRRDPDLERLLPKPDVPEL